MKQTDTKEGADRPTRVVILGGGPAGLAAAAGLSATPALRARYAVTVLQAGWRLGGKTGSGRRGPTKCIEQNGTHYLFGAYDNCFQLAATAFDELAAAGDRSFGTYADAFVPRSLVALKQFFCGHWHDWLLEMPTNGTSPGTGSELPSPSTILTTALQGITELVLGWRGLRDLQCLGVFPEARLRPGFFDRLRGDVDAALDFVGVRALKLAMDLVQAAAGESWRAERLEPVAWLIEEFRRWLAWALGDLVTTDLAANRLWTLVDLAATHVIGLIRDDVFAPGRLSALDALDYREWLRRHGGSDIALYSCALTTVYNAIAAYEEGDIERPRLSAAIGLYTLFRLVFTYKGALAWQMAREVGDTLIAPVYQALRNRGVSFEFFRRVWEVVPAADGKSIERITVERQAELRGSDPSYEPFIPVKEFLCWPNEPRWEQLMGGDPGGLPLDSFYRPRTGPTDDLVAGRDFDVTIYAMPIGTLRPYCPQLLAQRPAWVTMIEAVQTVDTQSFRCWWKPDLVGMGWPNGAPVLSGYYQPLATWEDNAQLLDSEIWPADTRPGALSTVFGPLPCPREPPGAEDPGYPERQRLAAVATAHTFLNLLVGPLWPGVTRLSNPVAVDWDKLADPLNREGAARFEAQSVRANAGPLERYTLAVPGGLGTRLRTDGTGYANLLVAGDWIATGWGLGCVEAAVQSGLQASRAIAGSPAVIPGEGPF